MNVLHYDVQNEYPRHHGHTLPSLLLPRRSIISIQKISSFQLLPSTQPSRIAAMQCCWRRYSEPTNSLEPWKVNTMSQTDFMECGTVLVLSDDDEVIGCSSKKESHQFTQKNQRGILHRAFSVFLYDASTQELLFAAAFE